MKRTSDIVAPEPKKSSLTGGVRVGFEFKENADPNVGTPDLKEYAKLTGRVGFGFKEKADPNVGTPDLKEDAKLAGRVGFEFTENADPTVGTPDLKEDAKFAGRVGFEFKENADPNVGTPNLKEDAKLAGAGTSNGPVPMEEDMPTSVAHDRPHFGNGCVIVNDYPPRCSARKLGLTGPSPNLLVNARLLGDGQRVDWSPRELAPHRPSADTCFASLLHGDKLEYFLYACVLGRRLRDDSPGPDRVLLCGPGLCCDARHRAALREAGWTATLPVEPIVASHLDQTWAKRHALVFTKLRVLELPYSKVLLLDVDLLPRAGTDVTKLFDVQAPAGKFHCGMYQGPDPEHGELLPEELRHLRWSPNAGVMRLDPQPDQHRRQAQVEAMVCEVMRREGCSYLPEQYYLAERLTGWRHLSKSWNWEVWPEWDDPLATHPLPAAGVAARRSGWAGYYLGSRPFSPPDASEVLQEVRIWHFSGSWDTAPWMTLDLSDPQDVREYTSRLFRSRDPGGVVATAHYEWRLALSELLIERNPALEPLHAAVAALAKRVVETRSMNWACERCGQPSNRVRLLHDVPWEGVHCSVQWKGLRWACADCIVEQLRAGDFQECKCTLIPREASN